MASHQAARAADLVSELALAFEDDAPLRAGIGSQHRAYRGETDNWLTPPEIISALGPFDLDPCSPDPRPWPTADCHFTKEMNGLSLPWHGSVWVNPPYGPETGLWLERLARHGKGFALIFARTETEMFHRWVWQEADGILFFEGRLHFYRPDGTRATDNAGGPSCLASYGQQATQRLKESKLQGKVIRLDREAPRGVNARCHLCKRVVSFPQPLQLLIHDDPTPSICHPCASSS